MDPNTLELASWSERAPTTIVKRNHRGLYRSLRARLLPGRLVVVELDEEEPGERSLEKTCEEHEPVISERYYSALGWLASSAHIGGSQSFLARRSSHLRRAHL